MSAELASRFRPCARVCLTVPQGTIVEHYANEYTLYISLALFIVSDCINLFQSQVQSFPVKIVVSRECIA